MSAPQEDLNGDADRTGGHGAHRKHGVLAMLACRAPTIAIVALIAPKAI